jgi:hypothetical protein
MDMLDDINLEAEVEEYIHGLLDDQKKVMGFVTEYTGPRIQGLSI